MIHTYFILWTMVMVNAVISDKDTAEEVDGYNFQYTVTSDTDNVHYGHAEDRHGYHTRGSYRVLLPDGRTQVVEYRVKDRDSGYAVKVSYTGVALVDTVQYNQHREKYKARKREISAGSYYKPVKIKPYRRHHEHQGDDIFTTTVPDTTESITVIPSPELVTAATAYDFDTQHNTILLVPQQKKPGYQTLSIELDKLQHVLAEKVVLTKMSQNEEPVKLRTTAAKFESELVTDIGAEENNAIKEYSTTLVPGTNDDYDIKTNFNRFVITKYNEKTNHDKETHIEFESKGVIPLVDSSENKVINASEHLYTSKKDKSTDNLPGRNSKQGSECLIKENEAPNTAGTYKHDQRDYFDQLESTEYDKQTASVITVEKPSILSKPSAEYAYNFKPLIEEKIVRNNKDYMTNQNTNLDHSPINPYAYTVYKPTLDYHKRPKQFIPQRKTRNKPRIFYNKQRFQQIPVFHGIPRISIQSRNAVSSTNTKHASRTFASPVKKPFFSFKNWFPFKF